MHGRGHFSAEVSGQGPGPKLRPTQAASVARPQQQFGVGCDLAFEFAIWGPSGLLSSKDIRGFLDFFFFFFTPKYFFALRRFEFLPSPFPRAAAVSFPPGFGRRKVRGWKRSGWGSRAAWRLSRAGQSHRALGRLPREARRAQAQTPAPSARLLAGFWEVLRSPRRPRAPSAPSPAQGWTQQRCNINGSTWS